MTEGYALALILIACLMYGKLCGVRNQLKRIADVCENVERRAQGHVE